MRVSLNFVSPPSYFANRSLLADSLITVVWAHLSLVELGLRRKEERADPTIWIVPAIFPRFATQCGYSWTKFYDWTCVSFPVDLPDKYLLFLLDSGKNLFFLLSNLFWAIFRHSWGYILLPSHNSLHATSLKAHVPRGEAPFS